MLYNLHLLRVIAALGVVYFHTTSEAGLKLDWNVGSSGVDLFFVISGFIIAYIGTSKPEYFLRRRLIRVAPFYWAATLGVFALVSVAPQLFRSTTSDLPHLAASLLFIPHEAGPSGMMPTLLLGWSLNLEIFFYACFALSLMLSRKWSPLICASGITAFFIAIHTFVDGNAVMDFYARPMVLEFCFGIAAFYLFSWCSARRELFAKLAAFKWTLAIILIVNLAALCVLEQYFRASMPRYIVAGVPAFFTVVSALLLERIYGLASKNRLLHLLGESSYIIYLVHPYIIYTALRVVVKDGRGLSSPMLALLIVGLLALTSAFAIVIHVWFEKPVMAFLRSKLIRPEAAPRPKLAMSRLSRLGMYL